MSASGLRITEHRPWRWPLTLAGVLIVCGVIGWYVYQLGQQRTAETHEAYVTEKTTFDMQREELINAVEHLRTENAELRSQVAVLDKQKDITQKAVSSVRDELAQYRQEIATLQKQLGFYESIVSPTDARTGLQIHDFGLRQTDLPLTYTFELSLLQSKHHERDMMGRYEIVVKGFLDEKPHSVRFSKMPGVALADRKYTFRYFQNMAGDLQLPEGFGPTRIEVLLLTGSTSNARVVQQSSYHWQNLIHKD